MTACLSNRERIKRETILPRCLQLQPGLHRHLLGPGIIKTKVGVVASWEVQDIPLPALGDHMLRCCRDDKHRTRAPC